MLKTISDMFGIIIEIPTINDGLEDFNTLFNIYQDAMSSKGKIIYKFTFCDFLRPNAVAFLGGLARLLQYHNRKVVIDWSSLKTNVLKNLRKNSFTKYFGGPQTNYSGNTIRYLENSVKCKDVICNYLEKEWLGRGGVKLSPKLSNTIVGNVWEIFDNAFEHASSQIGVFSCGQIFPRMDQIKLSIIDFGIGIPGSIREYTKNDDYESAACLSLAFQEGYSTKSDRVRRGLGLSTLKDFIKANNGCLEIFSLDGHALIDLDKENYENVESNFMGTIVNITLKCDEYYYQLIDEIEVRF